MNSFIYRTRVFLFAFFSCFFVDFTASGQSAPCGTEDALSILGPSNDPLDCTDVSACTNNHTGIYRIPVVVHIIHNNGSENISDAQVIEALNQLNEDFRKISGTPGFGGGVDTEIEFSLAKKDPNGNCSSGINRIQSTKTNVTFYSYGEDAALKNLSRWDQERYLNIWVVKDISGGGVGYAFQPHDIYFNVSWQILDGLVIEHTSFGRSGTAASNVTRALTHEVGHYMNLYHVWGKNAGSANNCHTPADCLIRGDRVCDTEPCLHGTVALDVCDPQDNGCNSNPQVNYPKENYMSYFVGCQERFTEGQKTRMHCALKNCRPNLWTDENVICSGASGHYGENIVIDASTANSPDLKTTIWNTSNLPNGGEISIGGNLTIKAGFKLVIQKDVTVHFCSSRKLIVEQNAILDLSGRLTNSCKDPWEGVQVYGNSNASQYSSGGVNAQGRIIGRDGSQIDNANIGVRLWGPDKVDNAGGIITCTKTVFKNNHRGVEFAPYVSQIPTNPPINSSYLGNFSDCNFITDDDYENILEFNAFLYLEGISRISAAGCSFSNTKTSVESDIKNYGYGIFATDAGFSVTANCLGNTLPCQSFDTPTFDGLGYGIYTANSTASKPFLVKQAIFNNCYFGIYDKSVSNATVILNTFNLGNVPNTSIGDGQVGLMFDTGLLGIACEENNFTKVSGNVTKTIGSIAKSLGQFNNEIRKNIYTGLETGNLALGPSGGYFVPSIGLFYTCNTNTGVTNYDFAVPSDDGDPIDPIFSDIRHNQGVEQNTNPVTYLATGNKFSYTAGNTFSDFNNQSIFAYKYWYYPPGTNETPIDFTDIDPKIASQNACLSNYCEPPCRTPSELNNYKSLYYTSRNNYSTSLAAYQSAVGSNDHTLSDQKSAEAAYHRLQMDRSAYTVVVHMLVDTLGGNNEDSIRLWVGNYKSFEGDIEVAKSYLRQGNYSAASSTLSTIPQHYTLDARQGTDLSDLQSIFSIIGNQSVYNLSQQARTSLETFANKKYGNSVAMAQSILTLYGYHYPPKYNLPEGGGRNELIESQSKLGEKIKAYPNPASDLVVFQLNEAITRGKITVVDFSGRVVWEYEVLPKESQVVWQTRDSATGVYFFQLQIGEKTVEYGKIILNK